MGTRNLACVVKDGQYKLARYCQWDGYPKGQGLGLLKFLRDTFNRPAFEQGLAKVQEITDAQLKQLWVDCGASPTENWVTMEVSEKFKERCPELSRDPQHHEIFKGIQEGHVRWSNPELSFAADSLFCEWCYVLDLDKNTFEVYKGFNEKPLPAGERFASFPLCRPPHRKSADTQYYPVRHVKTYSLRRLPSNETFLKQVDKR